MGRTQGFPAAGRHKKRSLPAIEWISDVTGRCARVTAVGNRSLLVENHAGVIAFSEDCVRLAAPPGEIRVSGSELFLCDIRPGTLIIRGNIRLVQLPCEGSSTRGVR